MDQRFVDKARAFLRQKEEDQKARNSALFRRAEEDFKRITKKIISSDSVQKIFFTFLSLPLVKPVFRWT
jgi:hypothetical protein